MLQLVQDQKSGVISVEEFPSPRLEEGGVLVENVFSLISAGTEKTSIKTAQASLIGKAKSRPDLVKQVIANIKLEGLRATYKKVQERLDHIKPLGYSSTGIVLESSVDIYKPGDRVACAGAGYANHAEIIYVPKNLVAKIPDNVGFDEAAFTTLGSIAMQGVRQADVRVGENVVVIGLGLLGILTAQILKASGCNVIGLDIDEGQFELANKLGCALTYKSDFNCLQGVQKFTNGIGADAVIITAATKSNIPIELAINLARKKGTVVVVGAIGMDVPRSPFYQKELNIRISCSYGPGRYDPVYEEQGIDYPIGYARWTENRNMQAFLNLIATKQINVEDIITHKFPISQAKQAYDLILQNKEKFVGVLLEYPRESEKLGSKIHIPNVAPKPSADLTIGFIGAGNFARANLLPHIAKYDNVTLKGLCTSHGTSAKKTSQQMGFQFCTTDPQDIFKDDSINVVFIATPHKSHGPYIIDALRSGKNVFIEKPLCTTREELEEIRDVYSSSGKIVSVGFNRRFSPYSAKIKNLFSSSLFSILVNYRVNAGPLPEDHWVRHPGEGGRIIGEACHFIDLVQFIADSNPDKVFAASLTKDESYTITIEFEDGSICTIFYLANGDRGVPKEYVEIFGGGKTAILHNFQELFVYENGKRKKVSLGFEKGYKQEIDAFLNSVRNGTQSPISFESIYKTTLTTFQIHESLNRGCRVEIK